MKKVAKEKREQVYNKQIETCSLFFVFGLARSFFSSKGSTIGPGKLIFREIPLLTCVDVLCVLEMLCHLSGV